MPDHVARCGGSTISKVSVLSASAMLCIGAWLSAQAPLGQPALGTCSGCRIELRLAATLRPPDSTQAFSTASHVARSKAGAFAVVENDDPGLILQFDKDGRHANTIRSGRLPEAQFRGVRAASFSSHDSLYVFSQTMLVFWQGWFARSQRFAPWETLSDVVPLNNGSFLIQAIINSPEAVGFPFHIVSARGEVVRSFGLVDEEAYRHNPYSARRVVAPLDSRSVWSSRLTAKQLVLWGVDGQPLRVINREAPWFEDWDPAVEAPPNPRMTRPKPVVVGLSIASNDRLWVVTRVADADWSKNAEPLRLPSVAGAVLKEWSWTPALEQSLYDTIVELVDAKTGRTLASERFRAAFFQSLRAPMVVERAQDPDGTLFLRVWHLQLIP